MKEKWRWIWKSRAEGGWDVYYTDDGGKSEKMYEVRTSALLDRVLPKDSPEPRMGLYAARNFAKGALVLVYTGEEIDDIERQKRRQRGGAKHVIASGRAGVHLDASNGCGYSAAGYANAPYPPRSSLNWCGSTANLNKCGISGTANRAISIGDEILWVYGGSYWSKKSGFGYIHVRASPLSCAHACTLRVHPVNTVHTPPSC